MRRLWASLAVWLWLSVPAQASMRFHAGTIHDSTREVNTVTTVGAGFACPDSANTEVLFNNNKDCDGDSGLTYTIGSKLTTHALATDGDSKLIQVTNGQAHAASSTNESTTIDFGFSTTDLDVARITVGKESDYTVTNAKDSYLALFAEGDDAISEVARAHFINAGQPSLSIGTITAGATLTVNGNATLGSSYVDGGGSPANGLLSQGNICIGPNFASGSNKSCAPATSGVNGLVLRDTSVGSTQILLSGGYLHSVPALIEFGWFPNTGGGPDKLAAAIEWTQATGGGRPNANQAILEFVHNAQGSSSNAPMQMLFQEIDRSGLLSENTFFKVESCAVGCGSVVSQALASGTTLTNYRWASFMAPQINGVAGGDTETITNAATLYLSDAPTGSNITFTNGPYALWVDNGAVRFDGTVTLASSVTNQGDITIQKADPTLIYDVVTATDTDFWAGVQDDAGSDDDDFYEIGKGTTPGSSILLKMAGGGNIDLTGKFTTYNNIATVSNGVPANVAKVDTTGLTANVASTLLYAVPASGAGMYRVSSLTVETTAGSISSTMPNVQIIYTDNETGGSITIDATPILGVAGIGQTGALTDNTVGTTASGVIVINAQASSNINYTTVNYSSNLAGMAYALHVLLEKL